jgi:hypothetical protein
LEIANQTIQQAMTALKQLENLNPSVLNSFDSLTLMGVTITYIIMRVCVFFEEYNIHFKKLFKNDQNVIDEIQEIKSLIYKKWSHIDDFRDEIVAHPYREAAGAHKPEFYKSVFSKGLEALYLDPYKVPNDPKELQELTGHLHSIYVILLTTYAEVMVEFRIDKFPALRK